MSRPGRRPIADLAAALWWPAASLETGAALIAPGSTLRLDALSAPQRALLFAEDLLVLAIGIALLAAIQAAVLRTERRLGEGPPVRVVRVTAAFAAWAIAFGWLSSWAIFRDTGSFLGFETLRMFLAQSTQLLLHALDTDPLAVLVLPALALAIGLGGLRGVPLWIDSLSPSGRIRLRRSAASAVVIVSLLAVLSPVIRGRECADPEPATGLPFVYDRCDLLLDAARFRSGPARYVGFRVLGSRLDGEWGGDPGIAPAVVRRPLVPLDAWLAEAGRRDARRWNVLVILVESLRPDMLGSLGGRRGVMPSVDSLAAGALKAPAGYAHASQSNYADMVPLSSHYPLRESGQHVYPADPLYPRVLIYDLLRGLGWRTAVISSQDERWGGMIRYLSTGSIDHFFHAPDFAGDRYVARGDEGFAAAAEAAGGSGKTRAGKIDDFHTVSEAIRWIEQGGPEPFFAYVNLQNSHVPYRTPEGFPRRFGSERPPFEIRFSGYPPEAAELVKLEYANSLAYVDAQLGRLFEHLKRTGLLDRSIVVLTGDTGQAFYEHGFAAHGNMLFEEQVRVPLLIHAPNLEPTTLRVPARHVDIPPTLLGLLGLPPHPSFQGRSILEPPLRGRPVYLVVQTPSAHQYGLVQDGFKLIRDRRRRRTVLFDLVKDPGENRDLSAAEPERTRRMAARLAAWVRAQLDYYSDPKAMRRWYPPVLSEDAVGSPEPAVPGGRPAVPQKTDSLSSRR